jgi:hypothetical protein
LAYPHHLASLPGAAIRLAWLVTADQRRIWVDTASVVHRHEIRERSMTKQRIAFGVYLVLTVLCAALALLTAAPALAVGRDFLFLGAVLFFISAVGAA